jgi:hypothetical protein
VTGVNQTKNPAEPLRLAFDLYTLLNVLKFYNARTRLKRTPEKTIAWPKSEQPKTRLTENFSADSPKKPGRAKASPESMPAKLRDHAISKKRKYFFF